jgi:hypothetical protein
MYMYIYASGIDPAEEAAYGSLLMSLIPTQSNYLQKFFTGFWGC